MDCWNCGKEAARTVEMPTSDGYREPWCADCIDRDTRGRVAPWLALAIVVFAFAVLALALAFSSVLS